MCSPADGTRLGHVYFRWRIPVQIRNSWGFLNSEGGIRKFSVPGISVSWDPQGCHEPNIANPLGADFAEDLQSKCAP